MNTLPTFALLSILLVSSTISFASKLDTAPLASPLAKSLDCPCPQLFAHRGASGNYPDSSMLAFIKADEFKVDILELDVHLSKDGHIIVGHDESLVRTTGQDILIAEATLAEIKATDAGSTFIDKDGKYPFLNQNIKIITFDELYQHFPKSRFNIELKPDSIELAEKVWHFISKNKLEQRIIVGSAHHKALQHYRSLKSNKTLTSASGKEIVAAYLSWFFDKEIKNRNYDTLQIPHNFLTKSMVDFFHANNIPVQVWTVNKSKDIERMLDIGVDAIMTDFPERAYSIYIDKGLRPSN